MDEEKVKAVLGLERQKYERMSLELKDLFAQIDELEIQRAFTAGRISSLEDMLGAWDKRLEAQETTEPAFRAPFSRQ